MRSVGLASGSPPPVPAATSSWRASLLNSLPARLVDGALLVLDRGPLGVPGHRQRSCSSTCARARRTAVQAAVGRQLGVERRRHDAALADQHGHAVDARRAPRRPAPTDSTRGARMNTPWNGRRRARRRRGRSRSCRAGGRSRCGARSGRGRRSCAGRAGRRGPRWPAGSSRRRCRTPAGRRRAARLELVEQPARVEQDRHRRGLAAGHHQRVDAVEVGGRAHLGAWRRRASASRRRVRGERALQREHPDARTRCTWRLRLHADGRYQPRSA